MTTPCLARSGSGARLGSDGAVSAGRRGCGADYLWCWLRGGEFAPRPAGRTETVAHRRAAGELRQGLGRMVAVMGEGTLRGLCLR